MEAALVVIGALNLVVSGLALFQAHRAFQSYAQVVALLRSRLKR